MYEVLERNAESVLLPPNATGLFCSSARQSYQYTSVAIGDSYMGRGNMLKPFETQDLRWQQSV